MGVCASYPTIGIHRYSPISSGFIVFSYLINKMCVKTKNGINLHRNISLPAFIVSLYIYITDPPSSLMKAHIKRACRYSHAGS